MREYTKAAAGGLVVLGVLGILLVLTLWVVIPPIGG